MQYRFIFDHTSKTNKTAKLISAGFNEAIFLRWHFMPISNNSRININFQLHPHANCSIMKISWIIKIVNYKIPKWTELFWNTIFIHCFNLQKIKLTFIFCDKKIIVLSYKNFASKNNYLGRDRSEYFWTIKFMDLYHIIILIYLVIIERVVKVNNHCFYGDKTVFTAKRFD